MCKKRGCEEDQSIDIIDSHSVKVIKISSECRSIDGGKKIKGRKRHIVTDTQELLIGLKVHAANEHDSRSGFRILERLRGCFDRLEKIYADGGYRGQLIEKLKDTLNCNMEITLRIDKATDFKPLPKRCVVERSFAWPDDFRRLSKDYERNVACSENMISLAFISLMLKRLE